MSSSESESDYERMTKKKRNKSKNDKEYKRRDSRERRERSKNKKYKNRDKEKKRKHKSRSPSSDSKSSSDSSKKSSHKNKNKQQKKRVRKYEDEIEQLKEKEIKNKLEMENRRKIEEEKKKREKMKLEEKNKPKERELTAEEKNERKKQKRLAMAKTISFLEKAEEKKNEELKIDHILEDFLDKDKDENENNKIISVDQVEIPTEIGDKTHEETTEKNNLENLQEKIQEREEIKVETTVLTFKSKMPQIPKEFLSNQKKNVIQESKPSIHKEIIKKSNEEEEDPLDAYFKTIEKDATIQDYEIIQIYANQQLQRRYDELTEKDDQDNVQMIDHDAEDINIVNTEKNGDVKQVITLEEILGKKSYLEDQGEAEQNEEEEFHKKFVESLKKTKAPEFDPLIGYTNSEEKKDTVIYQEDVNEYFKEDTFIDTEDAWHKAKRMSEKGKELKLVNHAEIKYEPFRKNLYIETREVSSMSEDQVIKFRKDHGDIKVRGKNIPKPIFNWYHCGLPQKIIALLEKKGCVEPFPIQSQAIPCIMSGRDMIGIAETGSGKTLAFVLPMLRHVIDQRPLKEGEGPIGFIMAPTRELATQIYSVLKPLAKILNLSVACVYGGAGLGVQVSELRRGVEIVVCTPGRMIEVLCLSNGKITNLQRVTYVVLDEADRMFDMGFEPQIARILANIRPDRQTVMFSATFPKQIENLAKRILIKPIEVVVGKRGQSCANVIQHVEVIDEKHKFPRLLQILGDYSECYFRENEITMPIGIIIFVDQQIEADYLYKELYCRGYLPLLIHGAQDQEDRNFAIYDFKTGVRNILISTSVCARGLDVKHCGLVINFKCPNHMEDYIHRIGRTGRAGRSGVAYTFISKEEAHLAEDILRVLEISKMEIPEELLELVRYQREKVEIGEAEKRRGGFGGRGYEFSLKEKNHVFLSRKELSKGYGMVASDEEDIEVKGTKKEDPEKDKTALALPKPGQLVDKSKEDERRRALLKDKRAQQIALDVGANTVKSAIIAGKSEEEALQMAQEAIEKVLSEYRPSVSTEKGVEQAVKVIDQMVERENIKNNIFTCELEINEYPTFSRSKVIKKEFLNSISDLCKCTVTVRGFFVEPGKKPPLGNKKLHLYIQGSSKNDVLNAYKEIKQILDESALNYYTMGNHQNLGKYHI